MGIEHRPAEVNDRHFIDHWEVDTVIHGHKQSGLVTLVERRSGNLLAAQLPSLSGADTSGHDPPAEASPGAVQTITLDKGSEFAGHQAVAKGVAVATYFCESLLLRAAWEQREHQWPDTAVLPQGNGLPAGHRCRAKEGG